VDASLDASSGAIETAFSSSKRSPELDQPDLNWIDGTYRDHTQGHTGSPVTMAADGTVSYSESGQFTDGRRNIAAKYSGDSTYAVAESQPITIEIQPSSTTLVVTT